jgi:methylenetetrahydrofolate dehydrogenase (NADP+)/methenyltetrahydrofolate cyclohydrolase
MKNQILDGKRIAKELSSQLKEEVKTLIERYNRKPSLASVQVGNDKAASCYIKQQDKTASDIGIELQLNHMGPDVSQDKVAGLIKDLNENKDVTGIILQMPLPKTLNTKELLECIEPAKDAEGLSFSNLGRLVYDEDKSLLKSEDAVIPPTAQSAFYLINSTNVNLKSKEAVIIGHSEIVGKPLSLLLLNELTTVTVCHIATTNIQQHISLADIVISAAGKPKLVKGSWIKDGAIVIDVGTTKVEGKIVGDIEFDEAKKHASFITPVPGGVGPLTCVMLMNNVVKLFKQQIK